MECWVTGYKHFHYRSKTVLFICLYNLCSLYQYTKYPFLHTLSHQHFILSNFDSNQCDGCKWNRSHYYFSLYFPDYQWGWSCFYIIIDLSILWLLVYIICLFFYWIVPFSSWLVEALHILHILNLCYYLLPIWSFTPLHALFSFVCQSYSFWCQICQFISVYFFTIFCWKSLSYP